MSEPKAWEGCPAQVDLDGGALMGRCSYASASLAWSLFIAVTVGCEDPESKNSWLERIPVVGRALTIVTKKILLPAIVDRLVFPAPCNRQALVLIKISLVAKGIPDKSVKPTSDAQIPCAWSEKPMRESPGYSEGV